MPTAVIVIWGFPKIRGTFLGVPIVRTIVYWGLYWVPLFRETTISILAVVELMTVVTAVGGKVAAKGCGIPIVLRQLWSLEFGGRA